METAESESSTLKLIDELKSLRTEIAFLRDAMKLNAVWMKELAEKLEKSK